MNGDCIHGMPLGDCHLCKPASLGGGRTPVGGYLIADKPERTGRAKYNSTCGRCGRTIYGEVDRIGYYQDEWIHLSHFRDGDK